MKTDIIAKVLVQAEKLCQQRAVRLTPQRAEVLRLIAGQTRSISAYELLDLLRLNEPRAKPPTVYRALDFWLDQGFIHKIESTNSYVMCHHPEYPNHTSALFICKQCGQVNEHHVIGIENILHNLAHDSGFSLHNSVIESHGICKTCQTLTRSI